MGDESDLEELDAFLLSLPIEDEGMLAAEFDGFCVGLVVCPQMIAPSEWIPCVWGDGDGPEFEDADAAQRGPGLIMAHYNSVANGLTPPSVEFAPVFDEDTRTGEVLWELWATGFERAMRLRPDSWQQIVESGDKDAAASVNLMLTLCAIADGSCDLPRKAQRKLIDQAPDLIPDLVFALNAWTKNNHLKAPFAMLNSPGRAPTPDVGVKTGRNAPCPCGSGRKYKRCCGAN
ncbi:MAG: UPF0149 family protein [Rhodobacter sp.]|nr:UPF0149 family protein [Rhodobacter sp.]